MPAFQLRVNFLSKGSFPYGTAIDHWVFSYVSGPTSLATVQVPATEQYLNYASAAAGAYQVSAQAQDASNNPIGSAIAVNFTVPNLAIQPALIPAVAYFQGNPGGAGSGQGLMRLIYQSLGSLSPGQVVDHAVVTLTGPSTATATVPNGQTTASFTGLVNGNYSYSIQSFDNNSVAFGPPMNSGPGGVAYFDSQLTTPPLLQPTTPGIVITNPGSPISAPGL